MSRKITVPMVLAMVLALPAAVLAGDAEIESPGAIHDRFTIGVGFFLPSFNTNALVSSPDIPGSGVDFEDDLGFKADDSVFRLDGRWRIAGKHNLAFSYLSLKRDSSREIWKEIHWEDLIFDVGVKLSGKFDYSVYKVVYQYQIIRNETWELGVGGGLSFMDFSFGVAGEARVVGEDVDETRQASWEKSIFIPVPALTVNASWAVMPNLYLSGLAEYLSGSYDKQKASYSDLNFSLTWYPWKNVGFAVFYDFFKIKYEDHGKEFTGRIDYSYKGPGVRVNFIF